jgi:hypothetical protein
MLSCVGWAASLLMVLLMAIDTPTTTRPKSLPEWACQMKKGIRENALWQFPG